MQFRCVVCGRDEVSPVPPTLCACGVFDSFVALERVLPEAPGTVIPLASLDSDDAPPPVIAPTGHAVVDSLLGGGFQLGTATTLYGDAGLGKSTLALALASGLGRTLVACPEMGRTLLTQTARRAGADLSRLVVAPEPEEWQTHATGARVVLIDSVSRMRAPLDTLAQAIAWAKRANGVALLIAHLTRDGQPLGGSAIEHDPDCVIRLHKQRGAVVLETEKCRWAPTGAATLSGGTPPRAARAPRASRTARERAPKP